MAGGHAWWVGMHGRKNSNSSGGYASYWNAFLLFIISFAIIIKTTYTTLIICLTLNDAQFKA